MLSRTPTMMAALLVLSQLVVVASQNFNNGQCDLCFRERRQTDLENDPDFKGMGGSGSKPRLLALTMLYSGSTPASIFVQDLGTFQVQPGGTFTISTNGDKLPTNTVFNVNGQSTTLHTSCSQPIYLGQSVGPFLAIDGFRTDQTSSASCGPQSPPPTPAPTCYETANDCPVATQTSNGYGGYNIGPSPPCILCCYPSLDDCPGPMAGQQCDVCNGAKGKPTSLTFTITGGAPTGSGSVQSGKGGSTGSVIPSNGPYNVFCQNGFGQIINGNQLMVSGFGGNDIMCSVSAGGPTQQISFHVSCSKRLVTGDQFGALRLDGFVNSGGSSSAPQCGPQEAPECELCCDMNPPVITTNRKVDVTVECDGMGNMHDINNWLDSFQCNDAETGAMLSFSPDPLTGTGTSCNRIARVTFECIDDCKNGVTLDASIRIIDSKAPMITHSATDGQGECNGGARPPALQDWLDDFGGLRASDMCHGTCHDAASYRYVSQYTMGDQCNCPSNQGDTPACANGKTYANLCYAICNNPGVSFTKLGYTSGVCGGSTPPYNNNNNNNNDDYFGNYLDQNNNGNSYDSGYNNGYNNNGGYGGYGGVQPTPPPTCGPVCSIFCANGNVLDSQGCPTCVCKSADIYETMMSRPDMFSSFTKAIAQADLISYFQSPGPWTVFAPVNTAWKQLGYNVVQSLFSDMNHLGSLIKYHLVAGKYTSSDLYNGQKLTTINGAKLVVHIYGATVQILNNDGTIVSTVVQADIQATNGVIHAVDEVLMPAMNTGPSCDNVTLTHTYPDFTSCGGAYAGGAGDTCQQCADVTFTATDPCGNKVSQAKTFRVTDTTAPTITHPTSPIVDCDDQTEKKFQHWLDTHGGANANDDCSGVSWSSAPAHPTLPKLCNGVVSVTFIVTDGCGRAASASASFTVRDNRPPEVVTDPSPLDIDCSSNVNDDPMHSQQYLNWIEMHGGMHVKDLCPHGEQCKPGYTQHNQAETDNYKCSHCQAGMSYSSSVCLDGVKEYVNMCYLWCHNGQVTDQSRIGYSGCNFYQVPQQCADGTVWSHTAGPLGPCNDGTANQCSEVTFAATDSCGNTVTRSTKFRLVDNSAPVLIVEAQGGITDSDFTLDVDLAAWLATHGGAEVKEGCSEVTWTYRQIRDFAPTDPGQSKCPEEALYEFIAMDNFGNEVTTRATFRIRDTDTPEFTGGEDLVFPCDESCGTTPTPNNPSGCDVCNGAKGKPTSLTFTITGGAPTGSGSVQSGKGGSTGSVISSTGPYNAFCRNGFGQLQGNTLVVSNFDDNDIYCTISGGGGSQQILFHVSCSKRLVTGDQFGAMRLDSFVNSGGQSSASTCGNSFPVSNYGFHQAMASTDFFSTWEGQAQSLLDTWLENKGCLSPTDCSPLHWTVSGQPNGDLCGTEGSVQFTAADRYGHESSRTLNYNFRKQTSVQNCPICGSNGQKAKISSLTLRYNGPSQTSISVDYLGQFNVQPGGTFTITAGNFRVTEVVSEAKKSSSSSSTKLPTNTVFNINGQSTTFHTSCSQPINVGMTIGGVLTIVGFVSDLGSSASNCGPPPDCDLPDVCGIMAPTLPPTTPPPTQCQPVRSDACAAGRPAILSFKYLEGSTQITNAQGGKAEVSGSVSGSASFTCANSGPAGVTVAPGGTFTIQPFGYGFDTQVECTVSGNGVQRVGFHTSCSKTLRIGDIFGSMQLVGFNGIQDQCLIAPPTPLPTPPPTKLPTQKKNGGGGGGGNGGGNGGGGNGGGNGGGGNNGGYQMGGSHGDSICGGSTKTVITSLTFAYNGIEGQDHYDKSQNPLIQSLKKPGARQIKLRVVGRTAELKYGKKKATVKLNDQFTVFGARSGSSFANSLKLKLSGRVVRLTTSCRKGDIRIGDQFGALKVVDYTVAGGDRISVQKSSGSDSATGSTAKSLSGGVVAGVVVCALLAVVLIIGAIVIRKNKRDQSDSSSEADKAMNF